MSSLQTRLSVGLIAGLAALTALVLAGGYYSLRQITENFVAARLEHDMETLLSALEFDADGRPLLALERVGAPFRQPYSGHYYRIEAPGGELLSRSLWDAELPAAAIGHHSTRTFVVGPQNRQLLMVSRAFQLRHRPVSIVVTEDFTPIDAGLRRWFVRFGLIALTLFGALLLLQRWLVRSGLAPLEQVRRELPRLARGEIGQLSVNAPDEVRPLVEELNRLLELMNQRQRRTRHALGNLAHALKTPLTALIQLSDQPPPSGDAKAWWQDLRQQIQRIRRLTERELKRARIAGGGTPGQRVVLAREISDLAETLRRIHRDCSLHFELRVPPDSVFPGDRDDLLELLGNLLDNACQWARRVVVLTANTDAGGLWLQVEDDGPGCPPDQLELLRQRGTRIDESRAGHGLGLAIIGDIVAQYGGTLRLGRSEALGGLLAEVALPRPPGAGIEPSPQ
ncbi:MAG: sensor histidine kinase [Candidatus Competibacteraceae bacterium]|nr:sensor histidine kinase [Candidatus Competibacteraceae bacterium]